MYIIVSFIVILIIVNIHSARREMSDQRGADGADTEHSATPDPAHSPAPTESVSRSEQDTHPSSDYGSEKERTVNTSQVGGSVRCSTSPREGVRSSGSARIQRSADAAKISRRYGLAVSKQDQAERIHRLEAEFGQSRVQRWVDEGMPVEAMGKPRDMQAFRTRQAQRSGEIPTDIERQNETSRQRNLDRKVDQAGEAGVPNEVRRVISSSGRQLPETVRREMESKLDEDFSDVQVHTGPRAAAAAEAINARAFAAGNHIAFNRGEYEPGSEAGKRVLAHELTHVRQQQDGRVSLLPQADATNPGAGSDSGFTVQPKLEVSSPDDPAEREAEAVAEAVVDASDSEDGHRETGRGAAAKATESSVGPGDANHEPGAANSDGQAAPRAGRLQRAISRADASDGGPVDKETESAVRSGISGSGKPLPENVRSSYESKMGADFSDVSIHTGQAADEAAQSINAEAFTLGSDIAFASGKYDPGSKTGQELLAHELTHVAQSESTDTAATSLFRQAADATAEPPRPFTELRPAYSRVQDAEMFAEYIPAANQNNLLNRIIGSQWSVNGALSSNLRGDTAIDPMSANMAAEHVRTLGSLLEERHLNAKQRYEESAEELAYETPIEGEDAFHEAESAAQMYGRATVPEPYAEWISAYAELVSSIPTQAEEGPELARILYEQFPAAEQAGQGSISVSVGASPLSSVDPDSEETSGYDALKGFLDLYAYHVERILQQRFQEEEQQATQQVQETTSEIQSVADALWGETHHKVVLDEPANVLTKLSELKPVEAMSVAYIWTDRAGVEYDESRNIGQTIEELGFGMHEPELDSALRNYFIGEILEGVKYTLRWALGQGDKQLAHEVLRNFREQGFGDRLSDEDAAEFYQDLTTESVGWMGVRKSEPDSIIEDSDIDTNIVQVLTNPNIEDDEALAMADAYELHNILDSNWNLVSDPDTDRIFDILEKRSDDQAKQANLVSAFHSLDETDTTLPQRLNEELNITDIDLSWYQYNLPGIAWEVFTADELEELRPYYRHAQALLFANPGEAKATKVMIAGLEDDPDMAVEAMMELGDAQPDVETPLTDQDIPVEMSEYFADVDLQTSEGEPVENASEAFGVMFDDEKVVEALETIHETEGAEEMDGPIEVILWGIERSWLLSYGAPEDRMLDALDEIANADNTEEQMERLLDRASEHGVDSLQELHELLGVGEGYDGWWTQFSGRKKFEAQRTYTEIVHQYSGKEGTINGMYELAQLDYEHISNGIFGWDPSATPERIDELWERIEDLFDERDDWAKKNEEGYYAEAEDQDRFEEFVEKCQQLSTYGSMYDDRRSELTDVTSITVTVTVSALGTVATAATGGTLAPVVVAAGAALVGGGAEVGVRCAMLGNSFTRDQGAKIMGESAVAAAASAGGEYLKHAQFMSELQNAGMGGRFAAAMVENAPDAVEDVVTDVDLWVNGEIGQALAYGLIVKGAAGAGSEIAVEEILQTGIDEEMLAEFDIDQDDIDRDKFAEMVQYAFQTDAGAAFNEGLKSGTESLLEDSILGSLNVMAGEVEDPDVFKTMQKSLLTAIRDSGLGFAKEFKERRNQTFEDQFSDEEQAAFTDAENASAELTVDRTDFSDHDLDAEIVDPAEATDVTVPMGEFGRSVNDKYTDIDLDTRLDRTPDAGEEESFGPFELEDNELEMDSGGSLRLTNVRAERVLRTSSDGLSLEDEVRIEGDVEIEFQTSDGGTETITDGWNDGEVSIISPEYGENARIVAEGGQLKFEGRIED